MSSEMLERRFAAVGARLKVAEGPWRGEPRIDIRTDGRGEYFGGQRRSQVRPLAAGASRLRGRKRL